MSRRIFLHANNFPAASNIFTKVIWKKEIPSRYMKCVDLVDENTRINYTLSIQHCAITAPATARASEKLLLLVAELEELIDGKKNKSRSEYIYKIEALAEDSKEKILTEEVTVYGVKSKLISRKGDLALPVGIADKMEFTIKPGLSVTLFADKELYLPYQEVNCEAEF